jgi:hypothetical protein
MSQDFYLLSEEIRDLNLEEQAWVIEQLDAKSWEEGTPPWDSEENDQLNFEWKFVRDEEGCNLWLFSIGKDDCEGDLGQIFDFVSTFLAKFR